MELWVRNTLCTDIHRETEKDIFARIVDFINYVHVVMLLILFNMLNCIVL